MIAELGSSTARFRVDSVGLPFPGGGAMTGEVEDYAVEVVELFDFGEKDNNYFIAMEYIDGIDLQTAHVRHKDRYGEPLPWEVSLVVVRDILRAAQQEPISDQVIKGKG